ncbi:MAG TPA: tetratricopeptide repeat protein [Ginsengibacter sp.]
MSKTILHIVRGAVFIFLISCNDNSKDKVQPALPQNSKESLKIAIKNYPDSLLPVQNLIEAYRAEGSYDSAIALTDGQIKKDTNNAYLWNMKATLHFENDDTADAIDALEHAVDIYPLPEYLVALGTIYAEVKNKKSLIIADGLLKANKVKSGADAMFLKGLYYSYTNDKPKAINYFDSSLHLDFTYMFSYREKAIALYDLGKYQQALDVLKRAVTVQNNFDEGYYWMGKCYEKLGSNNDAIQSFQMALLYDNNFIEAKTQLDSLQNKTQ